uniref:imidazole glycerol phosphate synthase subunit HisF n=1 Tax=Polynucleobacter sp. TaxID=2029855 RepID=UPI004047F233
MIKTRVIPVLLMQDGMLKKRIRFCETRTIATPVTVARVFESRRSDELILLDMGRTVDQEDIDPYLISQIAEELYMPFAYGGGIDSLKKIQEVIKCGAEKVVLNTAAVLTPKLISEGARKFGSQCIVVSIDAQKNDKGVYEVFIKSGKQPTGLEAHEWAKKVERLGAGEILINSIGHEGTMMGYDLELIKSVTDVVSIPVIAMGGVGELSHVPPAILEAKASAVAIGSLFHYTHVTPNMVKETLAAAGIPVRMNNPEFIL